MEIGEKIYGFEVKEKKYVREVEGDIIQMEHLSTGAQVIVIDNQDVKKSFLIGFRTIPKDSTGVFHILEHSVLNGSRRYPDKTMFVNLMKHSMAEFVNAITYPDHTVYPFCTENEKDFISGRFDYGRRKGQSKRFFSRKRVSDDCFRALGVRPSERI